MVIVVKQPYDFLAFVQMYLICDLNVNFSSTIMPRIFFFLTCLITESFTMISILEFFCFCFQIEWPVFFCLFMFILRVRLIGCDLWFATEFWVSTTEFFVITNLFTTKGKLIVKYEWIYIGEIWSKWICNYHYLQTLSTMTMFLSCHLRISEWIHTLYLLECQGTPCWKQVRNLKFLLTATGIEPTTTYKHKQTLINKHSTIQQWIMLILFFCYFILILFVLLKIEL